MRSQSNKAMERANINRDNWIQETCYISMVTSDPDDPNNVYEAWSHQTPNERRKWREAITKQLCNMENKKVLKAIYKTNILKDRRLIG